EEESAEVGVDRLDAGAQAVEVVAVGLVPQVLVEEELLEAEVPVAAIVALGGIDADDAQRVDVRVVVVEDPGGAQLVGGGAEDGAALDERGGEDQALGDRERLAVAEDVERAAPALGLLADRGREPARLEDRVRDRREVQEPVLGAEDRAVALERALVVRVD